MINIKRNLRLTKDDFRAVLNTPLMEHFIRRQFACTGSHEEIAELEAFLEAEITGTWYMECKNRDAEQGMVVVYLCREEDIKVMRKFETGQKQQI